MTDDEFKRLATLYGFAPSRPLREMLEAAVKAERKRITDLIRSDRYGIGSMFSQWTSEDVAQDIETELNEKNTRGVSHDQPKQRRAAAEIGNDGRRPK